jgi:hypothetical protein
LGDIAHFVAGVVAGAEARATDVDGIGAMQDGLASDGDIAGKDIIFLVRLVTVEACIVAAKRLTGTRVLPGGGLGQICPA